MESKDQLKTVVLGWDNKAWPPQISVLITHCPDVTVRDTIHHLVSLLIRYVIYTEFTQQCCNDFWVHFFPWYEQICFSSSINLWGSKDLPCNGKPIFLFFIIALALREHSIICEASFCCPGQGWHWIFSNSVAQNSDRRKTIAQNQTVITPRF